MTAPAPTAALSARQLARTFGISRRAVTAAVAAGELPASKLGARRLAIFRTDAERWLRSKAVRHGDHAERRVEELLAREARGSQGSR